MPAPNSTNIAKGKEFQRQAALLLERHFGVRFVLEHPVSIGSPPKLHHFDLASEDGRFVGESKNYCWTAGGHAPSAKLGFINEAVLYLQHLPRDVIRFVVLRRDCHASKGSLADHYVRANGHLLDGVRVFEADLEHETIREVTGSAS